MLVPPRLILFCTLIFAIAHGDCIAIEAQSYAVTPTDTGIATRGTDKGWIIYYYANSKKYYAEAIDQMSDEELLGFPNLAVVMFRINWSLLEPSEGQFDWNLIDGPAKRFIRIGLKIGIRITTSENTASVPYATPKWVFDLGARSHRFHPGNPGKLDENLGENREPVFDDPIFLQELDKFTAALASRYDGDPNVAFVDVGSFGVYGEGHTWSSTKTKYPSDTVRKHLEIYRNHFRKTLLVANDDMALHSLDPKARDLELLKAASGLGFALRDDSILVEGGSRAYFSQDIAGYFYLNRPVILEHGEYSTRVARGLWNDETLVDAIRDYHASYVGAYWYPSLYLKANRSLIERVNRVLGYRLRFGVVSWNVKFSNGRSVISGNYRVINDGVAPIYRSAFPRFELRNKSGQLIQQFVDLGQDVRTLTQPSDKSFYFGQGSFNFHVSSTTLEDTCNLSLFASIREKSGGMPIELPHPGEDGNTRTYFVRRICDNP